jgi:hypothetical protein
MDTALLWTNGKRSKNPKVGKVPTLWVGDSRAACRASCKGCPMLPKAPGIDTLGLSGGACYAHTGAPIIAHNSVAKAARENPERYTLASALSARHKAARMVRLSAIGDAGRLAKEVADSIVQTVQAARLSVVGYTHHWREERVAKSWRGRLMASCNDVRQADRAVSEGWRATVVVPEDTPRVSVSPAGNRIVVCPAQIAEGKVDCNACRLCDASKSGPIVAFREHGNVVKVRKIRAAKVAR